MKRYKILVAYDGTNYHGWQIQDHVPTVAGVLQKTFAHAFNKNISLLGTSRTDAGVHALGQAATFDTEPFLDIQKMVYVWNGRLPHDIYIRSIEEVPHNYHIFSTSQKIYKYHFFLERPLPFFARFGWFHPKSVELPRLEQALHTFVGTHDFRSFSTGDARGDDTIRTIDSIDLAYVRRYNAYQITVKGPRFLHHMIRRVVGASFDIASRKKLSIHYLHEVLAERRTNHRLTNAPAQGLILHKLIFNNQERYDQTLQNS